MRRGFSILLTFLCVVVSLVFFRAESVSRAVELLANMIGLTGFEAYGPSSSTPEANLAVVYIVLGLCIVWFMPNTQEILRKYKPSLQGEMFEGKTTGRWLLWRPTFGWALALGIIFFFALVSVQNPSTFLYFQF